MRRAVRLLPWLSCGLAFAQNGALRITDPLPSKDGTVVTSDPAISLRGTLAWSGGDMRVLWRSNRGFRDLASEAVAADGRTVIWNTTTPVPLRPGINQVRVEALGQPGAASFVNVFYTPRTPATPAAMGSTILQGRRITYEIRDGLAIYQSDIVLGRAEDVAAGRFNGRLVFENRPGIHPQSATIAPDLLTATGLWPSLNGIVRVPYTSTGVNAANIAAAIQKSNTQLTGVIQWVPATSSDTNLVNFDFNAADQSGGCESNIGMLGGVQSIGGSVLCDTNTVLHEMGHALGLYHEQSRSDRNTYVNYMEQNIDKPEHSNFDIYTSGVDSGLYNYASIMEYGPFSFSRDGLTPVLETIPPGMVLGNLLPQYSSGDLDGIRRLYGRVPSTVTVDSNPANMQLIVDGVTCAAPCIFTWTLGSQHTLNVPLDSHGQTLQTLAQQSYIFGRWNAAGAGVTQVTVTNAAGDGSLLRPSTSLAITNYLASFIPVHPYFPRVNFPTQAIITPSPAPGQLIVNGVTIDYYIDRQLVSITVTPSAGFTFYYWHNLYAYTFYANPYVFYITTNFDYLNYDSSNPVTAELVPGPVTTIASASPDISAVGTFPGFAIGVVETSNGNATTTAYTPRNFNGGIDGPGFAPGARLTLCGSALNGTSCPTTPLVQNPVTTNISYSFTGWSGAATTSADAANITIPSSSGQSTYSANYSPSFRTMVEPSWDCTGIAVTASPAGTNSTGTNGTLDAFFTPGTVNFSAASGSSGLNFAGWSQDLSGTLNPLPYNLQGQTIGTANYNVTGSAALSITSVTPAAPTATSAALDLVVTGTGFTTNNRVTFAFFQLPSGSFSSRSATLTSSTQLTIHLNAGDLATAGYYQIAVENEAASGCAPSVFLTFPGVDAGGPPAFTIAKSHTGSFSATQQNARYSILVTNSGTGAITVPVTVKDTVPSGETLVSLAGSGWSCTAATCTRSDTLMPGLSYSAITATVNVASNATSPQINSVTVSGGGAEAATATDSTVIIPAVSVPNVLGTTQSAATTAIQNAGLVVGSVTIAASSTVASGNVISENPTSGTLAAAGSAVNLVLSSGTATLQSIAVTPANPSISDLAAQQFTATGTYSDSSTQNLTGTATWSSGATATATISATGLATAVGVGGSTITATEGSVHGSTLLTVSAFSKCDIDQDGVTNVADVQIIIDEALGAAPAVNDLNGDGVVNVADVQIVINAALGLGCSAK